MKVCSKCKELKSVDNFYKRPDQPGNFMSQCKECFKGYWKNASQETIRRHRATSLKWRKQNPERMKEHDDSYKQGIKYCYRTYARNAKVRNIEFVLTRDEFEKFWNMDCFYCGEAIDKIGLDRIDNTKGYTLDNVVACCSDCNYMKRDMTQEKFMDKCIRIAERVGTRNV